MFEVRVTVSCPDLVAAAKLLKGIAPEAPANPTAEPTNFPTSATNAQTAAPINTGVPLATAPTFTRADIAKAGADLFTTRPDLQPQVMALLAQYGCQSVMDLKPEHFGPFATALRGMGAKI